MFDTLYTVKWNEDGMPELLTGKRNSAYVRLCDGSVARNNQCGLTPLAAIEHEILHIAATQAREHCLKRSERPWKIARMIQKLCHLAKTVRQQNALTNTDPTAKIMESRVK